MNCAEVKELLSGYYDGELPATKSTFVAEHLASCPECASELQMFQGLSTLSAKLRSTIQAPDVWEKLESNRHAGIQTSSPAGKPATDSRIRRVVLPGAIAAAILIVGAALWLVQHRSLPGHNHLAVNFGAFLDSFATDPDSAETFLVSNYEGRKVSTEEAVQELNYRPVAVKGPPPGYSVAGAYLLRMPCCRCLQVNFRSRTGHLVSVFEHDHDQPVWFGNRPMIETQCYGLPTRLIQVDGTVAASTHFSNRHLTIVGANGVDEVTRLVGHFVEPQAGSGRPMPSDPPD